MVYVGLIEVALYISDPIPLLLKTFHVMQIIQFNPLYPLLFPLTAFQDHFKTV